MPYVDLNRRFSKWRDEKASDEDFALFERSFAGAATWGELLKYQRVILLAEAGSGKSRELEERAKQLVASGEFAFHATVQNVAKEGLAGALDGPSRARLDPRSYGRPHEVLADAQADTHQFKAPG